MKRETKKVPVSFNPDDQDKIEEISKLIGIYGVYGDSAKVIKFSIDFTLSAIKNPDKVYSDLNEYELDLYFSAIKSNIKSLRNQQKIRELEENTLKSITSNIKKV